MRSELLKLLDAVEKQKQSSGVFRSQDDAELWSLASSIREKMEADEEAEEADYLGETFEEGRKNYGGTDADNDPSGPYSHRGY